MQRLKILAIAIVVLGSALSSGCESLRHEKEKGGSGAKNPPNKASNIPPSVAAAAPAPCSLTSRWTTTGQDARGAFEGSVAFLGGASHAFARHVDYEDAVRTSDGRRLAWAWNGAMTRTGDLVANVAVRLRARDFVLRADGVEHVGTDPEFVDVTGAVTFDANCAAQATYQVGGETFHESWLPSPGANVAADHAGTERKLVASVPPLTEVERSTLFLLFSSFHDLPTVAPYRDTATFKGGQFAQIHDRSDFSYYRANPGFIRVVDKIPDAVAVAETRARADAYAKTLAAKAREADKAMEDKFIDQGSKCTQYGNDPGAGSFASGDGALWNGVYLVSQIERHRLTGDAQAWTNLLGALSCNLMLQEIVPDKSQFARTIRTTKADDPNASDSDGWVRGIGAYAGFDWRPGGNNDMLKGVLIGLAYSFTYLCKPSERDPSLCARIRANARGVADSVKEATLQGSAGNFLLANWLAAYVTSGLTSLSYGAKAAASWAASKEISGEIASLSTKYGIADSSGVHLNFVSYLVELHLAEVHALPGLTKDQVAADVRSIMKIYVDLFHPQRSIVWQLIGAAMTGCEGCKEGAVWRLREMPMPKARFAVDHRLNGDFTISPFPAVPWKKDWTDVDRTTSLHAFPLFELAIDEYAWKSGGYEYFRSTEGYEPAVVDYVFAYWYGRKLGVIGDSD